MWLVSRGNRAGSTRATNYVLAQMIIERVTHDSYADQLRRRIITPRPAQHVPRRTSLPARGDLPAPGRLLLHISPGVAGTVLAVCHRPEPLHGVGAGLGRIVSSPPDVTKWARALFTGRELPRKQQRELESLISTKTGEPIKPLPVGQDPDALRTTDAALIVMTYTVLRAGSPDVTEAGDKRKAPDRGTYYFPTSAMFETSAKQYDWLRRIICVRPGNRLADGPAYNIFEVPS